MGRSLKRYLSPLLFPATGPSLELLTQLDASARLVAAQIELNEFLSRSVDAYCFDDSVRFVLVNDYQLQLREIDTAASAKWFRDGRKLERLLGLLAPSRVLRVRRVRSGLCPHREAGERKREHAGLHPCPGHSVSLEGAV